MTVRRDDHFGDRVLGEALAVEVVIAMQKENGVCRVVDEAGVEQIGERRPPVSATAAHATRQCRHHHDCDVKIPSECLECAHDFAVRLLTVAHWAPAPTLGSSRSWTEDRRAQISAAPGNAAQTRSMKGSLQMRSTRNENATAQQGHVFPDCFWVESLTKSGWKRLRCPRITPRNYRVPGRSSRLRIFPNEAAALQARGWIHIAGRVFASAEFLAAPQAIYQAEAVDSFFRFAQLISSHISAADAAKRAPECETYRLVDLSRRWRSESVGTRTERNLLTAESRLDRVRRSKQRSVDEHAGDA